MRFAIATVDRYLGVFEAFIQAGWEPVRLFTRSQRPGHDTHQVVAERAAKLHLPIQVSPITTEDLRAVGGQGCDVLIVASYDCLIPDWRPFLKHAMNFHCSPLPEGRGPYPVTRAILENRGAWAVTCHQLTTALDQGDILAAEHFPLQTDECHESLDLKIQMAARRLATRVADQFIPLWRNAQPQTGGSYWPQWTDSDRTVDFTQPVAQIMRQVRAFGLFESLAHLNDMTFSVRRAVGWPEAHHHMPGQAVHTFNNSIVVAAADGYIGLLEWTILPPDFAFNKK